MEKFSKVQKKKDIDSNEPSKLDGLEVIQHDSWTFIKENDMVAILPYFVDDGNIFLRSEPIPTYQYANKNNKTINNTANYLTVLSANIGVGESISNAVRRELYEEAGIVLSNVFPIVVSKPLFLSKKNCTRCYLCLLEIRYNDYRQTTPKNLEKNLNTKASTVKIDLGYIDDISSNDIITELMLDKLRDVLPIKK